MKKSYRDCLNRIACYADGATGLVEHEYKKVKTKTIVPVGGEYFIERDKTITVLRRTEASDFEIESPLIGKQHCFIL